MGGLPPIFFTMKYLFIIFLMMTQAFANLDTEMPQILEFGRDEFHNQANYAPDGKRKLITKDFHDRVKNDATLLKYFFVNYLIYQFEHEYKNNSEFKDYLKKKFKTSSPTEAQQMTVKRMLSSLVFSDTTENLKFLFSDEFDTDSDEYFNQYLKKLDTVRFR